MGSSSQNQDALIVASKVTKSFRDRNVLHDIELSIHQGQVVTLIGPNGAGKLPW